MLDKDAIFRVVDLIAPHDFYKPIHRDIYEAMLDLFNHREPLDVLSVANRLKEKNKLEEAGGSAYLATLVNSVPTASHVEHYGSIVKRKRLLRDLIEASGYIAQLGYQEAEDVESLIDEAEQKIFSIAKDSLRQEFVAVKAVLEETWERIERIHRDKDALRGVTTGFTDLDNILGGLQRSDLIILAARPSLGKTSFALDMARNAALAGVPVGIFSLEMSRDQLIDRLIAAQGNVDLWRLRTGHLYQEGEDNDFMRIQKAMAVLADAPIYIDDSPSLSAVELRAKARRLQTNHQIGLIFIDYLQLVKGGGHNGFESRVQEVSEISRSIKAMAKELNIPVVALSQLSRGVEMRPSSEPKLSDLRESGCLAGNTLITRADTGERIPIKNLVGQTNIPIFSLNNSWKLEKRYISKVFSSGYKQLFEIKTRSGHTIKASSNHPFLTISGWRPVELLEKNMFVALPRNIAPQASSEVQTENELGLLAHLLGDGCVLPRQPIHYTSADMYNIEFVRDAAFQLFNITPRIVKQKNWYHVYLPSPYRLARNRRHPITLWFEKLGIQLVRSYEKQVPGKIFQCSREKIAYFLHHLWATDGNISWKRLAGRKDAAAIYYSTTSKILAEQVQHLLLRLGIIGSLRMVTQGNHRPNYQVHVQGSEMQLRFCQLIGSFGDRGEIIPSLISALRSIIPNPNNDILPKETWKLYVEPAKTSVGMGWREVSAAIQTAYCGSTLFKAGISRTRMARIANACTSDILKNLAESDVYWDEVVSITALGIEEVFDATVPETYNFIANDFIVHNSIEQDADVVMFIYREDKVKENSEKKNIAEIRVLKHRNGPVGSMELYFHAETASFKSLAKHMETPEGF